ncbi:large subunit ribosomal protein L25 [Anaerobranca californiensis DSM 14826]|uniref:Large ribosomal subunit protein bL25 n=1 Tax=Anaerobranca californiensis DSM 14826 TaxID=1120989 RepID=A0A1M6PJ37_9FIRM|nr:50S ribosomal protein L25 [Anaerobranca californiensis]SHK07937.1 large subunit ribosomal protein L25 [Anaerobranca californiensis DSM 14826]
MSISLTVNRREGIKKSEKNRLRRQGFIPGVIYGKDLPNLLVTVPYGEFVEALKKGAYGSVISVIINNENHSAIIKEIQRDLVTGNIIHVDFQKVYSDQRINKEVPIKLVGDEIAKKTAIIQLEKRGIEVRGLPYEIPKQIELDVSHLTAGTVISVGQIAFPPGIEVYTPKNEVVLSLVANTGYLEMEPEVSGGDLT